MAAARGAGATRRQRRGTLHQVNAAVIDIPYAVVRRHLLARRAIPASADSIVTDCARASLPN